MQSVRIFGFLLSYVNVEFHQQTKPLSNILKYYKLPVDNGQLFYHLDKFFR